jgi:hypothetical protein
MMTAKLLRRQAATCAALAKQTHDEDSRQRCVRLEQMYLHLAQTDEQLAGASGELAEQSKKSSAG